MYVIYPMYVKLVNPTWLVYLVNIKQVKIMDPRHQQFLLHDLCILQLIMCVWYTSTYTHGSEWMAQRRFVWYIYNYIDTWTQLFFNSFKVLFTNSHTSNPCLYYYYYSSIRAKLYKYNIIIFEYAFTHLRSESVPEKKYCWQLIFLSELRW